MGRPLKIKEASQSLDADSGTFVGGIDVGFNNPAGNYYGVVGGDTLEITVQAAAKSHCLITTPGATKFYRSKTDLVSQQTQKISVAKDAVVEWLPQQNIFFPVLV